MKLLTDLCRSYLRAGTKYTVSVFGMFDGGESMPLAGEEKTTLSDAPPPPTFQTPGKINKKTKTTLSDLWYFNPSKLTNQISCYRRAFKLFCTKYLEFRNN